jgi:hypothetical protein
MNQNTSTKPQQRRRVNITRRRPDWLWPNVLGRRFTGWILTGAVTNRLPNGRWKTETCWERREQWTPTNLGGGTVLRLQAHDRVPFWTGVRLLWFLLRGKEGKRREYPSLDAGD